MRQVMAAGWPSKIIVALLKRRRRQVALEDLHLLQPRAGMSEPRSLEPGEVVAVRKHSTWSTTVLVTPTDSCSVLHLISAPHS